MPPQLLQVVRVDLDPMLGDGAQERRQPSDLAAGFAAIAVEKEPKRLLGGIDLDQIGETPEGT